eukprot:CAMPEP_0179083828 /NCGR_PEP_ID=MMETSP0796-20121207/37876_1 /TAXON_ID=73915 /ORGANISM="Pyrodinium bahamense, Strain pbaha01" /LENGTH=210 /DNA_ID=CAMNT_0020781241 /DNA_START=30 /DNA_END=662 /DNA_ORIENTATION=+
MAMTSVELCPQQMSWFGCVQSFNIAAWSEPRWTAIACVPGHQGYSRESSSGASVVEHHFLRTSPKPTLWLCWGHWPLSAIRPATSMLPATKTARNTSMGIAPSARSHSWRLWLGSSAMPDMLAAKRYFACRVRHDMGSCEHVPCESQAPYLQAHTPRVRGAALAPTHIVLPRYAWQPWPANVQHPEFGQHWLPWSFLQSAKVSLYLKKLE